MLFVDAIMIMGAILSVASDTSFHAIPPPPLPPRDSCEMCLSLQPKRPPDVFLGLERNLVMGSVVYSRLTLTTEPCAFGIVGPAYQRPLPKLEPTS